MTASGAATTTPAAGWPVIERAIRHVRLLAAGLMLLAAAGYRPSDGVLEDLGLPAGPVVLTAALVAAAAAVCAPAAGRRWSRRRTALLLVGTCVDLLVILTVVCVVGLPPRSLSLVLLILPLLEAALWFGMAGLAATWLAAAAALTGYVLAVAGPDLGRDIAALLVALPVLLLTTMPVAVLAEHLVAEVAKLQQARSAADDRAELLGDLSRIAAGLFPLDLTAVAAALTEGAHQLGAAAAVVLVQHTGADRTGDGSARVVSAGPARHVATLTRTAADEEGRTRAQVPGATRRTRDVREDGSVLMTWPLALTDENHYLMRALVHGRPDHVARHMEALDLLVAQGHAALANAELVDELTTLKHTYQEQATRDQLTGLVNRRGLLARSSTMAVPLGVLFCDLDGFKAVNDTLGHAAGDELLRQVGQRLHAEVGTRGVLSRLGGDEFVVVVPAADALQLTRLAGRVERSVGQPYELSTGPALVGVSIGTATAAADQDLEHVLAHADEIMYQVKRDRRALPRQLPRPASAAPESLR